MMFDKIPERFLRDAVLIGKDTKHGRVNDEDLLFLQGEMRSSWRNQWDELWEHETLVNTRQNFAEALMPLMLADATPVAGVTEGVLWPAANAALAANFFDAPGKLIRLRAFGVMTTGATPGTLTLTPRFGTTTGGTTLGAGTVSGTLATSVAAVPWFLDATCVCRAVGTAGSLTIFGIWESPRGYTAAPGCVECGNASVAAVDTTSATGGITMGATLSNAGSSLTTRKMSLESLT